jgi:biopolymer transport protein ExbD
MPKVKIARKSTSVDMTAMTDVAFLLLTFFMLATKFKPDEPVAVDTPSSISITKLPDVDIMLITVDKQDRVFFGVDGDKVRKTVLEGMGKKYNIVFTPAEIKAFSLVSSFGIPIEQMKKYLATAPTERNKLAQTGIPTDSLNNQLADWVWQSRLANNNVKVAVKGDRDTDYPIVKKIIATLQDKKVNRFNFITSMEQPEK